MIGWVGVGVFVFLAVFVGLLLKRPRREPGELEIGPDHLSGKLLPTPGVKVTFWDGGEARVLCVISETQRVVDKGKPFMDGPAVELHPPFRREDGYWISARDFWSRVKTVGDLRATRPKVPPPA